MVVSVADEVAVALAVAAATAAVEVVVAGEAAAGRHQKRIFPRARV